MSTAAVPVTRLPQDAHPPQVPGLYQFFPYVHTLYFDGRNYHTVPTPPPANRTAFPNSPHVNNRHVNDAFHHFSPHSYPPLFTLPPKEMKAVPIWNPYFAHNMAVEQPRISDLQIEFEVEEMDVKAAPINTPLVAQTAKDTPLGNIVGKEPTTNDYQLEIDYEETEVKAVPVRNPLIAQSAKDMIVKHIAGKEPKARSHDYHVEIEVEESDATMVLQKEAAIPPEAPVSSELMKNDATTSHDEPKNAAEAGEKTSKTGWETESSARKSDGDWKPASGLSDAFNHQTKQSSVPVEILSTNVALLTADSGSMPEASRALPDNGWAAAPVDRSTAERDGKPQLTSLGGWDTSQDDHAGMAKFETPTKGAHHSELTSPARTLTQDSKAPVAFSTPQFKDVSAGIMEWQMLSKMNVECNKSPDAYAAFVSPDKNKMSSVALVEKISELFISQPEKKPLEQKAEPNSCEVTQSNSESHQPTAIPEATALEIHNLPGNAGTNESSSRLTLNCMEPVGDEPKSMIANSDWSSTDKKENSEEPVKSVNAPSFDNSLPVEMTMNSKQVTSDTKSDRGAQSSMPARRSSSETMEPPRGMLLLRLKVRLPEGRIAFLEFRDGDCLQTVAKCWCRVWKVSNASTQAKTIVDAIYTRLDKYLA